MTWADFRERVQTRLVCWGTLSAALVILWEMLRAGPFSKYATIFTCSGCDGIVPLNAKHCPHCETTISWEKP